MAKRKRTRVFEFNWYGDDFFRIVEERGEEALQAAAKFVLEEALRRVPRRTGKLARSAYWATQSKSTYQKIQYGQKKQKRVPDDQTIVFGFSARHSHLVERKVQRHPIQPRRRGGKQAVAPWGWEMVFARVEHPGSKAQRFFGPALDATQESMVEHLAKNLRVRIELEMPD